MNNITNISGEPVSMSALLGQVAICVQVRTSCLGLGRIDRRASAQMNQDKRASTDAGKAIVSRLAGVEADIKTLKDIQTEGQDLCKALSTPWNGRRLMPNINFQPFLREIKPIEARFEIAKADIIAKAPQLIAEARANLGDYDIKPPTLEEFKNGFAMEIIAEPIPDVSKYSASNLDNAMEEQLREVFEQNTKAAFQFAQQDVLQRLAVPLRNVVNACNNYNERDELKEKGEKPKGGYSRSTIVTNVQDIAYVFGSFNLFNDPELAKLDEELKVFFTVNYEDLRDDNQVRDEINKKASDILAKLDGYL
jgi:hypothetical protein